jgi:hypothetical protein
MSYGYTLLAESFQVARKRHRCIWCGESILPGETYRRERSVYDGEMQNFAWHPECSEAACAEWMEGADAEFCPHENERPALAAAQSNKGEAS